jgi:hypothetical protein
MVSTRFWPGSGSCSVDPSTAARIQGRVHAARNAVQLRLELLLQAAQAIVVHAHIAQHLRGNLVVRIETAETPFWK